MSSSGSIVVPNDSAAAVMAEHITAEGKQLEGRVVILKAFVRPFEKETVCDDEDEEVRYDMHILFALVEAKESVYIIYGNIVGILSDCEDPKVVKPSSYADFTILEATGWPYPYKQNGCKMIAVCNGQLLDDAILEEDDSGDNDEKLRESITLTCVRELLGQSYIEAEVSDDCYE